MSSLVISMLFWLTKRFLNIWTYCDKSTNNSCKRIRQLKHWDNSIVRRNDNGTQDTRKWRQELLTVINKIAAFVNHQIAEKGEWQLQSKILSVIPQLGHKLHTQLQILFISQSEVVIVIRIGLTKKQSTEHKYAIHYSGFWRQKFEVQPSQIKKYSIDELHPSNLYTSH